MAPLSPLSHSRLIKLAGLCLLVVGIGAVLFLIFDWPFRQHAVVAELEDESFSKVTVGSFRETYFPRPGCVLEHVVFQHNRQAGAPPLITIEQVRIEGSFAGLFAGRVRLVEVQGLRIRVPPLGSEHFETPRRSTVVIDQLVADGATLQVGSPNAGEPGLTFAFRGFTISDVGGSGAATFKATLSNPEPPGEITTTGKFGPWNEKDVSETPVSGEYYFDHADLSALPGISGLLSSSGKYDGTLGGIAVDGSADVPQFAVIRSSHKTQLQTRFHAVVNAENGDVSLQQVNAGFRQTLISAQGGVAGKAGAPGKTASLEIASQDGRIQDLLLLITKSRRAPMSGNMSFRASVSLPSGPKPFLDKVELRGDFGIDAGSFARSTVQEGVNSLSRGARGEKNPEPDEDTDPESVLSDLRGHVLVKDGTAHLSGLAFGVPGALAQMSGTYDLISEKINLHGTLKTEAEVSKTTHGIKSAMLKVLEPFFKNKRNGYTTPVKITGTYDHPAFGLDLGHGDDQKALNPRVPPARLAEKTGR